MSLLHLIKPIKLHVLKKRIQHYSHGKPLTKLLESVQKYG